MNSKRKSTATKMLNKEVLETIEWALNCQYEQVQEFAKIYHYWEEKEDEYLKGIDTALLAIRQLKGDAK